MKKLTALVFLWPLLALAAQTDLKVNLTDFALNPATNRTVYVQPLTVPTASSSSTVIGTRNTYITDGNGIFYISNVVPNMLYSFSVQAPPSRTDFMVLISTNDTGLISAYSNMTASATATFPAGNVAWSAASSDLRYARRTTNGLVATFNPNQFSQDASGTNIVTGSLQTNNIFYSTSANIVFKGSGGQNTLLLSPINGAFFPLGMITAQLVATNGVGTGTVVADGPSGNVTASNFIGAFTGNGVAITNLNLIQATTATTNGFWPITVTGAGQSGVNGLYNLVATNTGVANAGWAKGQNAGGYLIFLNGVKEIANGAIPPMWTIDDPTTNHSYYDNFGLLSPFGGWENNDLINGGIGGALLEPIVLPPITYATNISTAILQGTNTTLYIDSIGGDDNLGTRGGRAFKTLRAAEQVAQAGDVWYFYPGTYYQQYVWHITNGIVYAPGATILFNGSVAFQAVGTFDIYGGAILNTNIQGQCADISQVTGHFRSTGTRYFGSTDCITGVTRDNVTFDFLGGEIGTYWDGNTISGGGTNSYQNYVGVIFHGYYNAAAVAANGTLGTTKPIIFQIGFSNTISGCSSIVENGFTNRAGGSSAIASTGGTTFMSGVSTAIGTNPIYKVYVSGGSITFAGHPFKDSEVSISGGQVFYNGDATNDFIQGGVMSAQAGGDRYWTTNNLNLTGAANKFTGTFTNSASSGNAVQFTDANRKVSDVTLGPGLALSAGVLYSLGGGGGAIGWLTNGNNGNIGDILGTTNNVPLNQIAYSNIFGIADTNNTIRFGRSQTIQTNTANDSSLWGGDNNTISGRSYESAMLGGTLNRIGEGNIDANEAIILGGDHSTNYAIAGLISGHGNFLGFGNAGFVGGHGNLVGGNLGGENSFIGSGTGNYIGTNASGCSIVGGQFNNISNGVAYAFLGGGFQNQISPNGTGGTIPGGYQNTVNGFYSFAAGQRAKANQNGVFIWADSQAADYASVNADTFNIRAQGGMFLQNGGFNVGGTAVPNAGALVVTNWASIGQNAHLGQSNVLEVAWTNGLAFYINYTNGNATVGQGITLNGGQTNTTQTASSFAAWDANKAISSTFNGNGLTNLTYVLTTNAINTGVGTVGDLNRTNIGGAITLGGFTGLVSDKWNTVIWLAQNASGADRIVTYPANTYSQDGVHSTTVTNNQAKIITFGILPGVFTNASSAPYY